MKNLLQKLGLKLIKKNYYSDTQIKVSKIDHPYLKYIGNLKWYKDNITKSFPGKFRPYQGLRNP